MSPITKHIIKAIDKATKIERARHPDWDDNKHRLNLLVDINKDDEKIIITTTKENIVRDNLQSIAKSAEVLGWNNKENK